MYRRWISCVVGVVLLASGGISGQSFVGDSSQTLNLKPVNEFHAYGFLTTSFLKNSYWRNRSEIIVTVSGSLDVSYSRENPESSCIHELRTELGYRKFPDSTWIKVSDEIFISSTWNRKRNRITTSSTISLQSQLTNSWEEVSGQARTWISGPLLPFSMIGGYGINIRLRERSYINVSVFSLKMNSMTATNTTSEAGIIFRSQNFFLESQAGASIRCVLRKTLFENLVLENRSVFFFTIYRTRKIEFDLQNIARLKLLKFLALKLEARISYDESITKMLQSKFEFVAGVVIER